MGNRACLGELGVVGHGIRETLHFPSYALLGFLNVFDVCITASIFQKKKKKSYVVCFFKKTQNKLDYAP